MGRARTLQRGSGFERPDVGRSHRWRLASQPTNLFRLARSRADHRRVGWVERFNVESFALSDSSAGR
jgi:hypothetical protein